MLGEALFLFTPAMMSFLIEYTYAMEQILANIPMQWNKKHEYLPMQWNNHLNYIVSFHLKMSMLCAIC